VVDGDDVQWKPVLIDSDSGLCKGGGGVVDGYGVVRVGCVTADVYNDGQFTLGERGELLVIEGGDGLREVDAVDKYVMLAN